MRRRLLGTIAAVAAGAGGAWGQSPAVPPPAPIGPVGGYPQVMTAGAVDPIPPQFGGPGGPAPGYAPDPMFGGPGGGPMPYPPPGPYGGPQWQPGFTKADGWVDSRIAPRVWLTAEFLLWFSQAQPTVFPFVVTSAPAVGGVLGRPTTAVLHSNTDLGYNAISGFRVTGGVFTDDARRYGWYASGFLMEHKANIFNAASDATGQPLLARPFIDATTGLPSALFVSFPTFSQGNVTVFSGSRAWGAEGGPIVNLFRTCPDDCAGGGCSWDVNMLGGFRYFQLQEELRIEQQTALLNGATADFDGKIYGFPARIGVIDDFKSANRFYGGNIGLQTTVGKERWSLGLLAKIALGVMHEEVVIDGFSTISNTDPPAYSRSLGGLYANASNVGKYKKDVFAVLPEVGGNIGYSWTTWFRTFVGYNFLYVSRVARPGAQYSPVVNPSIIPTSPAFGLNGAVSTPNPAITQSDYWLQGVSFGFTLRY